MGFSGDGRSLISYAASGVDSGGCDLVLELWACNPPKPLRRVLCLPLFNCEHGGDFGANEVCGMVMMCFLCVMSGCRLLTLSLLPTPSHSLPVPTDAGVRARPRQHTGRRVLPVISALCLRERQRLRARAARRRHQHTPAQHHPHHRRRHKCDNEPSAHPPPTSGPTPAIIITIVAAPSLDIPYNTALPDLPAAPQHHCKCRARQRRYYDERRQR